MLLRFLLNVLAFHRAVKMLVALTKTVSLLCRIREKYRRKSIISDFQMRILLRLTAKDQNFLKYIKYRTSVIIIGTRFRMRAANPR